MTTTQITLYTALFTSLFTLIPLLISMWLKLKEALAPLLARKRLKLIVVTTERTQGPGAAFVATLRIKGYSEATVTRSALSCAGYRAVVLWHPDGNTAEAQVREIQDAAPEAFVLILTHQRLSVTLGERVLLANSELRLRSDVATIAELP